MTAQAFASSAPDVAGVSYAESRSCVSRNDLSYVVVAALG